MCVPVIEWGVGETYLHYIHLLIVNPEGSMVQQYSTINHLNTHVHDSEATLARHVARFDAIATSCGSATPWQSLNRLFVGHCIESDTSSMSVHRTFLSTGMRST